MEKEKEAYSSGTITNIGPVQEISEKFKKMEFVIITGGQYPKSICFEAVQDKVGILSNYNVDDAVTVHYNLESRSWSKDGVTKWFTSAKAWKVETYNGYVAPIPNAMKEEVSDLPF
jgi:hypothetical protein